jgi:hypothetical protein
MSSLSLSLSLSLSFSLDNNEKTGKTLRERENQMMMEERDGG